MNDTEYYSFGDRLYETPTTSRDEQMSFADNLRAAQQAANAQIKTQTENLGTQVPSVKGGLTGPEGYFQSRYQSAPTNALVSDLRAAAQADALNKVLANYSSQMQKQYNDAYRQYQKNRARRAATARNYGTGGTGSTGGTGGAGDTDSTIEGGIDLIPSQEGLANEWLGVDVEAEQAQYPDAGTISTINTGDYIIENGKKIPIYKKFDENGRVLETNDPNYNASANTSATSAAVRYATASAPFGPFGFIPGVAAALFGGK